MKMKMNGRIINKGTIEGEALVSKDPISFYGGVEPETGRIADNDSDINGVSIKDKILVFPYGKGSTVGPYTIYQLAKLGNGPKAMINTECETIVAVGCIISDIPAVDKVDISQIKTGDRVRVSNDVVEIL